MSTIEERGSNDPALRSGPFSGASPNRFGSFLVRVSGGREIWALSDQALVSGSNFLTNVMLARALGLTGFGVFALCWIIVLLMSSIQMALIISPMMSVGPKQEPSFRPLYFGAVTAQAACLVVSSLLLVYFGALCSSRWFPAWNVGPLALPLAIATGSYLAQDYLRRYFFTIQRNPLALASDALSYLTQLPIIWLLSWRKELTSSTALWTIALTSLFSVIVSVFWLEELRFSREVVRTVAVRHWVIARWLAPSAVLQWAGLNIFMIFAPVYYGAESAGALRACQNVVAIAHVWFIGLDNVIPTEAARQLHEQDVSAFLHYIRKMLTKWGLITIAFMAVITAAPSFWLRLLYGARYTQFGYVLSLYAVLYLVIFIGVPLRGGLIAMEFSAPLLWSFAAMTVVAAFTAGPMAKQFGLFGVMLGLIATQFLCQAILGAALVVRIRRMLHLEQTAPAGVNSL